MSESQAIARNDSASIVERVMLAGDLSKLNPTDRVAYYVQTCKSLGLNPLTRPFEYITLNGKLTLYARKDATDQLRKINSVSIGKPEIQQIEDLIIVTVVATDKTGRTDSDLGVVKKSDMRGDLANAMMKAVTKAKRRVTLSICGLGMLDETEVETIPDARPVVVADTGEIVSTTTPTAQSTIVADPLAAVRRTLQSTKTSLDTGSHPKREDALKRYNQLITNAQNVGIDVAEYSTNEDDPHITTILHCIKGLCEALIKHEEASVLA